MVVQCNEIGCDQPAFVVLHMNIHFKIAIMGSDYDQEINAEFCEFHASIRWIQYKKTVDHAFARRVNKYQP